MSGGNPIDDHSGQATDTDVQASGEPPPEVMGAVPGRIPGDGPSRRLTTPILVILLGITVVVVLMVALGPGLFAPAGPSGLPPQAPGTPAAPGAIPPTSGRPSPGRSGSGSTLGPLFAASLKTDASGCDAREVTVSWQQYAPDPSLVGQELTIRVDGPTSAGEMRAPLTSAGASYTIPVAGTGTWRFDVVAIGDQPGRGATTYGRQCR